MQSIHSESYKIEKCINNPAGPALSDAIAAVLGPGVYILISTIDYKLKELVSRDICAGRLNG